MDADDARMEYRWDGMHGNLQEFAGNYDADQCKDAPYTYPLLKKSDCTPKGMQPESDCPGGNPPGPL